MATARGLSCPRKLVFNKIDRYNNEDQKSVGEFNRVVYLDWLSLFDAMCPDRGRFGCLESGSKDKITLLSGHSGVGKSTIINKLVPGVNLRTGDISEYHNKGMHTTTFSEMISLPGGGYLD